VGEAGGMAGLDGWQGVVEGVHGLEEGGLVEVGGAVGELVAEEAL